MRPIAANDILDSVAEITSERNCERFRHSLAGTVREMMSLDEIVFAQPVTSDGVYMEYCELYRETCVPAHATGGRIVLEEVLGSERVLEMLTHGHHINLCEGVTTLLLPVVQRDALVEVVVLRAPAITPTALSMIKDFTRLYRNFRSLIMESERDALTGLLNRRTLESRLDDLIRDAHLRRDKLPRGQRSEGEASVFLAVLDIDHFKRINDTLGHLFGDEVILLLARLMRSCFRDEDLLFRFGGEEFIVILLAHSAHEARIALERFRELVTRHRFPQLDHVTVSIGLTQILANDVPATVVGRADQALYHAKENGRNRLCEYEALRASGALKPPQETQSAELF